MSGATCNDQYIPGDPVRECDKPADHQGRHRDGDMEWENDGRGGRRG